MESNFKKLNRFTTIPFLIDLLKRKQLTLLNPQYWEDYNDRETMEVYRKLMKAKSIYALCFTHQNETIHHWNAFANGTSGCCIEFSPDRLIKILDQTENVGHGKTEYISLKDLSVFETAKLPYLKRQPFKPENEYRIIATPEDVQRPTFDIDLDLNCIRRITITNKMPESVFQSVKEIVARVNPEFTGKIYHSTLYNNPVWINHFKK